MNLALLRRRHNRRSNRRERSPRRLAGALAAALAVAACGAGVTVEPSAEEALAETRAPEAHPRSQAATIRFALPWEPLWQWLEDSGALADLEATHEISIEAAHPFRPFTALVSGDADIILIDALSLPEFAQGLDHDPVIIGKYASERSIAAVKRTSQATDLAGVVEGQVATEGRLGSTLLWSLIVEQAHALDLSYESRDFEYLVATIGVADTVESGEADACICQPDASTAALSDGMLRPLYDGRSAAQLYAELQGTPDQLPLGKVFVAQGEWYHDNPHVTEDFLALWETALDHWHTSYPEIIAAYPELLSLQTQQHVDWLTHHVTRHNWIMPTVYLTEADEQMYLGAVDRLQALGHLPGDARLPAVSSNRSGAAGGHH